MKTGATTPISSRKWPSGAQVKNLKLRNRGPSKRIKTIPLSQTCLNTDVVIKLIKNQNEVSKEINSY